jgi:hypothetical protein
MAQGNGLERMRQRRPAFRPLLLGLHWPSLPWGDEEFGQTAFAAGAEPLVDLFAQRLADTPAARQALRVLFAAAASNPAPPGCPTRPDRPT